MIEENEKILDTNKNIAGKVVRVVVKNVTKRFCRKIKKIEKSTLAKIVSLVSINESDKEFKALNRVSFNISAGEIFGMIGKNGSGKSTLLKIIAGVYSPDSGLVKTRGKLIYITGFGQGLKPKLTMKENIYLMGSVLGLSKTEIDKKLDKIVKFSGLKDYLYTKVDKFSSGMVTRLGFSISIYCFSHHKPDILIIDEAFGGGGDITFQDKAAKKMEELIKCGATVIMASHSLALVKKHCNRVVLLDKGKIVKEGNTGEVVDFYEDKMNKRRKQKIKKNNRPKKEA